MHKTISETTHKRGKILFTVLQRLADATLDAAEMFDVFWGGGYGMSISKFEYELSRRRNKSDAMSDKQELERKARERYHKMLYKLKRDGLIQEKTKEDKKRFVITALGKAKLVALRKRPAVQFPEVQYAREHAGVFTIITFDVPEKERRKRNWLRDALKHLGLTMIQQSVFIGKTKIPKEFLDDMACLNLLGCIEIFQVSKTGSLKHVVPPRTR